MDVMKSFSLEGKVALVTGAAYGIGFAIAEAYAKAGAKIVFNCRGQEHMDLAMKAYEEKGIDAKGYLCDVTDEAQVADMIQDIEKTVGTIDILVNNAGVRDEGLRPVDKVTDSEIDRVVGINTKGVMYCTRAVLKDMLKNKKGVIINVASSAGLSGGGGAAYVASKAAILGITKHTAIRCAKSGVRCNALCPSMIKTPMADTTGEIMDSDMMESVMAHSDLTLPVCSAQDVANSILFFASDEAAPITGQCVALDYGSNL